MSFSRFRAAAAVAVSAALTCTGVVAPAHVAAQDVQPVASPVVINEVESNGDPVADWVELVNTNTNEDIDISGWKILDDNDKHDPIVLPDNTSIESGGYYAFYTENQTPDGSQGFGLGKGDTVRVFDREDNLVASTTWQDHVNPTWGRIPDKTGEFAATGEATRGFANKPAAGAQNPEVPGAPVAEEPWPYDPADGTAGAVYDVPLGADFTGDDMSGIDFDINGLAWIVNNGLSKLYALDYDHAKRTYSQVGEWELRYPDGTGKPDAEGVTIGADGALYVATERDNSNKKVSRPSVLRYETPAAGGELVATDEWNLAELTGQIEPNSGWEAISYIPEHDVYALGLEANGKVYFVDLKSDGTHALKQEYQSPFGGVMALDYRPQDKQLRVLCDEVCDGSSILLAHNGTEFAPVSKIQARPAGMATERENEGYASFTSIGTCANGKAEEVTRFLWADDGGSSTSVGLRGATTTTTVDCGSAGDDKGSDDGGSTAPRPDGSSLRPGDVAAIVFGVLSLLLAGPAVSWVVEQLKTRLPR